MKKITVKGIVERYPGKGGWYYIAIPKKISESLKQFADRGLVPIEVTLGSTTWKTSLLPKGDGTQFIALKCKVRKNESISLGDKITVRFKPRLQ